MRRLQRGFAWVIAFIAVFAIPIVVTAMAFIPSPRLTTIVTALVAGWLWRRSLEEVPTMREFVRIMERP